MTKEPGAALARVLLVEDDVSIARFIEMALEDQGLELTVCTDVESALAVLKDGPVQLIISDLMLPGLSGYDLLDRLHAEPALVAGAKVVIFSAGLGAGKPAELEGRGVWRVLSKPASVVQLLACVSDALAQRSDSPASQSAVAPPAPGLDSSEDAAIAAYFDGNTALFLAYRAKCLAQFANDLAVGDAALRSGDLPALQRLSHSLSTVFCTLGWAQDGRTAKALESRAAEGDAQAAAMAWGKLRARLLNGGLA